MKKQRSWWLVSLVFAGISVFLVLGCKSTPEEPIDDGEPTTQVDEGEKPTETEGDGDGEGEKPEVVPEPLTQAEIDAARQAIQRAQLIGANDIYPVEYRGLTGQLNEAIEVGDLDPDEARNLLAVVILSADDLYDRTLAARKESYVTRLERNDGVLRDIEADKFAPLYYEETVELGEEAEELFNEGDLWEAQQTADAALASQAVLYYNLEENKRYIAILRRDTENYVSDAEDNQAYLYAPEELEGANNKYEAGVAAYQAYDLAISEDLLAEAKHDAVEAARISAAKKRQAQTDLLMSDTEQRIEAASMLRVIGEDGVVQEAEPWDGDDYLRANPLLDPTPDKQRYVEGDTGLRDFDEPADIEGDDVTEIPIETEGTQVKGDEQTADYLVIAQNLWTRGVEARNVGNYDLADEYFNQARTFIEAYEAAAVERTYTVVYREVATDCLWRIAEYDDIYANPFLWPRIWRANKKIIQNPDLIFPGQVLVIPPEF